MIHIFLENNQYQGIQMHLEYDYTLHYLINSWFVVCMLLLLSVLRGCIKHQLEVRHGAGYSGPTSAACHFGDFVLISFPLSSSISSFV